MTAGRRLAAGVVAMAVLLVGCSGGGAIVGPSGGPSLSPSADGYALEVEPAAIVGRAIPGQPVTLLVSVNGSPGDDVAITATAPGATVSVSPARLSPGTVGEVTVVPEGSTAERAVDVTIEGERGGIVRRVSRQLTVVPGEDSLGPEAAALLGRFTGWLATNRSDLGIGPETRWEASPGGWVLVVNHYQFETEDWELGLSWHVMVPPDDWARIYLRRRWTEAVPSAAFEIQSVTGRSIPRQIEPPDAVWR